MPSVSTLVAAAAFGASFAAGSVAPRGGTCPASSTATKCKCASGFEYKSGKCQRPTPAPAVGAPTKCWRSSNKLLFSPPAPATGLKAQVREIGNLGNHFTLIHKTKAGSNRIVFDEWGCARDEDCGPEQLWFQDVFPGLFQMRFIDSKGRAGRYINCFKNTPIGFDLDMSGSVEKITGQWMVDMDGDGEREEISEWFAPTEGILLDARAPLGEVVTGEYMFGDTGNAYEHGYEKLSIRHDFNSDHIISGHEMVGLKVWVDVNSNAIVEEGELHELNEYGIVAISVDEQNLVSEAMLADGSQMMTEDVIFNRL